MVKDSLSDVVESLNRESYQLLHSTEYLRGKKTGTLIHAVSHFDIPKIREVLKYRRLDRLAEKKRLVNKKELWFDSGAPDFLESPSVLYSCITGGYDEPLTPVLYGQYPVPVLFTDRETDSTGWQVRSIDKDLQEYSNPQINRYIKFHPFEFFTDYEFSVYTDGNIKTYGDIRPLLSIARTAKSGMALHLHSDRDCLYDEAAVCILYGKGDKDGISRQVNRYRQEHFPAHYGLLEANVIITDLRNPFAKEILENWWKEYLESESGRDQLALPYTLWKMGLKTDDIGILGTSSRQNPKFRLCSPAHHTGQSGSGKAAVP